MLVCGRALIVMLKEDNIDWQDLAASDYHLFGPMKEGLRGKHYSSDKEVKPAVMKRLKEQFNRILQGRDTCSHSKVEHCY